MAQTSKVNDTSGHNPDRHLSTSVVNSRSVDFHGMAPVSEF